ncbi:hypothetical protein RRG08_007663 [Elysia crispata]|uniref:Uncharacterized protein n=1 Tax=Elysia crispata TaxID=231223 RepID=A0AAE0Y3Q7_9GAST|nr:hypothetical protein RRG08_007663 [Elysia crispata]
MRHILGSDLECASKRLGKVDRSLPMPRQDLFHLAFCDAGRPDVMTEWIIQKNKFTDIDVEGKKDILPLEPRALLVQSSSVLEWRRLLTTKTTLIPWEFSLRLLDNFVTLSEKVK